MHPDCKIAWDRGLTNYPKGEHESDCDKCYEHRRKSAGDTFKTGKPWRGSLWKQKADRLERENVKLRKRVSELVNQVRRLT